MTNHCLDDIMGPRLAALAATVLLWQLSAAEAAGPPAQLRGKAVTLSWSDNRVERSIATGHERAVSQTSTVTVYVGTEGRFFSEFGRNAGHGTVNRKDVSGDGSAALSWHMEGGTLVADQRFTRGVRRLIVTIDGSASTCSLRVLHGKEAGSSVIEYKTMKQGEPVELTSINVTSTNCAISTGNPFAG